MALTISGTTLTGVNVNTTLDNPITILSSAYIASGNGQPALAINGNTNWIVTNAGRIHGELFGVYMGNATAITNGTFVNSVIGQIYGSAIGIDVSGTVTVANAGAVSGGAAGVSIENGSVTNLSSGTVTGGNQGISVNTGSVTNAGLVTSSDGDAVEAGRNSDITNLVGGTITSGSIGISLAEPANVTNAGLIAAEQAVYMELGGNVTNQSGGVIRGSTFGIYSTNYGAEATYTGTVMNGGLVSASIAIYLKDGGGVSNLSLADIAGTHYGISIKGSPGSVTNAGAISGTTVAGILIGDGGGVSNQSGGTISGPIGVYGYVGAPAVTVANAGLISGSGRYGVWLRGGGGVTNQSTGTITGNSDGIFGAGTMVNGGTIGGGDFAVNFYAGSNNRLIVAPGAVFSGAVNGGNGVGAGFVSTLELASAASAGQISGLGSKFTNFGQVAVDAGSQWTVSGTNTLAGGTTLTDVGALTIFDGSLVDDGSVIDDGLIQEIAATLGVGTLTGTGELLIGGESTLVAAGSVAAGETIDFAGTGLLALAPSRFSGQIDGLGGGGRIELIGVSDATSAGIVNKNTLAIQQSAGPALDLTLDPSQSYAGMVFPIATGGGNQFVQTSEQVGPTVIAQGETESVTGAAGSMLAAVAGEVGGITVTGTNSLLITTAGPFDVGDTGLGGLLIEAGGTAKAQSGLVVANAAGAAGSAVEVAGAGSNLRVTGGLVAGYAGSGSLSLSQGASVTASSLDVAAGATGDGNVSIAGTGTTLDITGSLTLGDQAAGELSILGGAQMTIGGGVVGGTGANAAGNLDIEGLGSQLTIKGGALVVGANGPAEFTLGVGATLKGEVSTELFGVTNEYGNVDPATDPNDGTQNVGFGNSSVYDFFVANSGTIHITAGTATFYTPLVTFETNASSGSTNGLWQIGSKDTLVMNATSVDSSQTFDLTSPNAATLVIGQVPQNDPNTLDTFNGMTTPTLTGSIAAGSPNVLAGWDAPIENYVSGDVIVLRGLTYGSATASGDVVTVWSGGGGTGSVLGDLTFIDTGDSTTSLAALADAAAAAVQINAMACFAAGTRIETLDGLVAVEDLSPGDEVRTVLGCPGPVQPDRNWVQRDGEWIVPDGGGRTEARVNRGGYEPIVWIGSRAVDCARHPKPETVWPVRVRAGAFGVGMPMRDLYLSPDHAVFVNEVLVPVRLLVNGTSISQVKLPTVTYYHVELPDHAVILAEGLTVESYLDVGGRANFGSNVTARLFPDFPTRPAPDSTMVWETRGAAPLVMTGVVLEAARAAIAANVAQHGDLQGRAFGTG